MNERVMSRLPAQQRDAVNIVLRALCDNENVRGLFIGGSLSYQDVVKPSDIDLFCVFTNRDSSVNAIVQRLTETGPVETCVFQGEYPWTKKLYTLYLKEEMNFAIDLCAVSVDEATDFFWEPNGIIIKDIGQIISSARHVGESEPGYTKQPFLHQSPFGQSIIALKKICKNLTRGNIWNAMEQLNIMRRYLMQIVRVNFLEDLNFLGRVDREIELAIPAELNARLGQTVPKYNSADVAYCTIQIIEIYKEFLHLIDHTNENKLKPWIMKHLSYEESKLQVQAGQSKK